MLRTLATEYFHLVFYHLMNNSRILSLLHLSDQSVGKIQKINRRSINNWELNTYKFEYDLWS